MKWLLSPLLAFLSLECIGCPCTLADCADDVSVSIHPKTWPTDPLTINVILDNDKVTCTNLVPKADSPQDCSDERVNVFFPDLECSNCTPSEDDAIVVNLSGGPFGTPTDRPERVWVEVLMNDTVLGTRTFEPDYDIQEPNGPFCSPSCYKWGETWELP